MVLSAHRIQAVIVSSQLAGRGTNFESNWGAYDVSEDDNESSGTSPLLGGPVGEFADEDDESKSDDGVGSEQTGVGEGESDEDDSERRRPDPNQTDGPTLRQARESSVVEQRSDGGSESAPEWPDEETGEQDAAGTDSTRVGLGLQMPDDDGEDETPVPDQTPVPEETPAPGGPAAGMVGDVGADTPAPDEDDEDDQEETAGPKGFGVVNPPGDAAEEESEAEEDEEGDLNEESSGVLGFDGVRSGPDSEADDSSDTPDRSDS